MGEAKTRIIDEEHCFVSSCNINGEKVMEAKQGIPLKSVKRSAIDEKTSKQSNDGNALPKKTYELKS